MGSGTHYEVLGVAPDAPAAVIRDAYRRRARDRHPDRLGSTSAIGGGRPPDEMASINEAYRVLSDPARRAVYDAGLRGSGSAVPPSDHRRSGGPTDDGEWSDQGAGRAQGWSGARPGAVHPSHVGPARVPWRMLLFSATVAIIGVVVLAQFTEPGEPLGPDGILRVGDCVTIEANGDAREVTCSDVPAGSATADLVVEAFVPFDATCPGGTEPHRDRQGMGVACIARPE